MKNKHLLTAFLALYIITLVLLAILHVPEALNGAIGTYDKLFHFLEFFILAALIFKVLAIYKVKKKILIGSFVGLALIAISESVQLLTTTRTFSAGDIIADVLGFTLGLVVILWISSKQ